MTTMNKKHYDAIAAPFKKRTGWTQYLYANQGFKTDGTHNERGIEIWSFLKAMDDIVFPIANNLADVNGDKFDRDKFLKACGMMKGSGSYGSWSYIPNKDYINKVQHIS